MSYFVTVTFDLHGANPNVYPRIRKELERIDFSKVISGRKRILSALPANFFVAKFEAKRFPRSSRLIGFVATELKEILARHSVGGDFFAAAGQGWAWKLGSFSPRRAAAAGTAASPVARKQSVSHRR